MGLNSNRISHNSSLIRVSDLIYNEIDGEVVILSINNGEYYNLNKTGSELWNILEAQHSFIEIIDYLVSKYDINRIDCETDTLECLEDMIDNGIIKYANI